MHGGKRKCPKGCTCNRHTPNRRVAEGHDEPYVLAFHRFRDGYRIPIEGGYKRSDHLPAFEE